MKVGEHQDIRGTGHCGKGRDLNSERLKELGGESAEGERGEVSCGHRRNCCRDDIVCGKRKVTTGCPQGGSWGRMRVPAVA